MSRRVKAGWWAERAQQRDVGHGAPQRVVGGDGPGHRMPPPEKPHGLQPHGSKSNTGTTAGRLRPGADGGLLLGADVDLDTTGSGGPDAGDAYWRESDGWLPPGTRTARFAVRDDGVVGGHPSRRGGRGGGDGMDPCVREVCRGGARLPAPCSLGVGTFAPCARGGTQRKGPRWNRSPANPRRRSDGERNRMGRMRAEERADGATDQVAGATGRSDEEDNGDDHTRTNALPRAARLGADPSGGTRQDPDHRARPTHGLEVADRERPERRTPRTRTAAVPDPGQQQGRRETNRPTRGTNAARSATRSTTTRATACSH